MNFCLDNPVKIANRALIYASGSDIVEFLQGQISNDMNLLTHQNAIHGLLLTPQGKILADLFIYNYMEGYLLDIHSASKDWLLKRFNMFKLRSDVSFSDKSEDLELIISQSALNDALLSCSDPRLMAAEQPSPIRNIFNKNDVQFNNTDGVYSEYMAKQGIIEFGDDYQASEFFPQDLWFDKLTSVDFKKGCYVGQEVVSRMRHKSTARKRLLPLASTTVLSKGETILLNDKKVGEVINCVKSKNDYIVLAMIRLDKLSMTEKQVQDPQGNNLTIWRPKWSIDI